MFSPAPRLGTIVCVRAPAHSLALPATNRCNTSLFFKHSLLWDTVSPTTLLSRPPTGARLLLSSNITVSPLGYQQLHDQTLGKMFSCVLGYLAQVAHVQLDWGQETDIENVSFELFKFIGVCLKFLHRCLLDNFICFISWNTCGGPFHLLWIPKLKTRFTATSSSSDWTIVLLSRFMNSEVENWLFIPDFLKQLFYSWSAEHSFMLIFSILRSNMIHKNLMMILYDENRVMMIWWFYDAFTSSVGLFTNHDPASYILLWSSDDLQWPCGFITMNCNVVT